MSWKQSNCLWDFWLRRKSCHLWLASGWALQLCSNIRWLHTCQCQSPSTDPCVAKSSQSRWKEEPILGRMVRMGVHFWDIPDSSDWYLSRLILFRNSESILPGWWNRRPWKPPSSDNQIRYDPPESGATNPDSTPFSPWKRLGTPANGGSRSQQIPRSTQLKDQRRDWAHHLVPWGVTMSCNRIWVTKCGLKYDNACVFSLGKLK